MTSANVLGCTISASPDTLMDRSSTPVYRACTPELGWGGMDQREGLRFLSTSRQTMHSVHTFFVHILHGFGDWCFVGQGPSTAQPTSPPQELPLEPTPNASTTQYLVRGVKNPARGGFSEFDRLGSRKRVLGARSSEGGGDWMIPHAAK